MIIFGVGQLLLCSTALSHNHRFVSKKTHILCAYIKQNSMVHILSLFIINQHGAPRCTGIYMHTPPKRPYFFILAFLVNGNVAWELMEWDDYDNSTNSLTIRSLDRRLQASAVIHIRCLWYSTKRLMILSFHGTAKEFLNIIIRYLQCSAKRLLTTHSLHHTSKELCYIYDDCDTTLLASRLAYPIVPQKRSYTDYDAALKA